MTAGESSAHVAELLRGGWQRSWIRYSDGALDDTSTVVWLQHESAMADVRVPESHSALQQCGSLAGCTLEQLRLLADSESSTGTTVCTQIEVGADGVRRATAQWPRLAGGVEFQPVSGFPEPGLLEWNDDATVMLERAPSGAYVEQWRRIPDTETPLEQRRLDDGSTLYLAGSVAVRVRDRPRPIPAGERLEVLIAEAGDDRSAIEALVDCEFSLAHRRGSAYVVTASTHPWRIGEVIDVAV